MNPDMQEIITTVESMIGVIFVANHAIITEGEEALFQRVLGAAHTYDQAKTLQTVKDDILALAESYMNVCDLLPFTDPDMWDRVKQVKDFCGDFSMKPAAEY